MSADFARAAALIEAADALVICAGAGMGVDSGLPDFRSDDGFWRVYPALRSAGLHFTAIANPAAFRRQPDTAWGFYGHRLQLYRDTTPHNGFAILQRWASTKRHGAFIFTSNVDGQFQRAGFDSDQIVECHGSIHHLQCTTPCRNNIWSAEQFTPQVDRDQCLLLNAAPRCPHCGALARPNILMFGDGDWIGDRSEAQQQRLANWLQHVENPVVIELGAGLAVPTVRWFSESLGCPLIRINPRDNAVPYGQLALCGGALETLQQIDRHHQNAH